MAPNVIAMRIFISERQPPALINGLRPPSVTPPALGGRDYAVVRALPRAANTRGSARDAPPGAREHRWGGQRRRGCSCRVPGRLRRACKRGQRRQGGRSWRAPLEPRTGAGNGAPCLLPDPAPRWGTPGRTGPPTCAFQRVSRLLLSPMVWDEPAVTACHVRHCSP